LRKYSGEQELIWGGQADCQHKWVDRKYLMHSGRGDAQKSGKYSTQEPIPDMPMGDNTCSLCGAWKGSYGLEPDPESYVAHTILILREIRRVLRKDGVVFWNIGDSYYGGGFGTSPGGNEDFAQRYPKQASNKGSANHKDRKLLGSLKKGHNTLKPKDLCLIPFRVVIAAQEDGWWVRSVIIWSKPNPMPESVTDRPTESHEYILMLTKSARYYFDQEAVREAVLPESIKRDSYGYNKAFRGRYQVDWEKRDGLNSDGSVQITNPAGRNIRTVWEFPTQPYAQCHFAVFPEKLPEICIKAASKENDLVLDPFMGAGTTLWVAKKLDRKAVGFELSEEYCRLALERNRQQVF